MCATSCFKNGIRSCQRRFTEHLVHIFFRVAFKWNSSVRQINEMGWQQTSFIWWKSDTFIFLQAVSPLEHSYKHNRANPGWPSKQKCPIAVVYTYVWGYRNNSWMKTLYWGMNLPGTKTGGTTGNRSADLDWNNFSGRRHWRQTNRLYKWTDIFLKVLNGRISATDTNIPYQYDVVISCAT